jgi:hypothetical protein
MELQDHFPAAIADRRHDVMGKLFRQTDRLRVRWRQRSGTLDW